MSVNVNNLLPRQPPNQREFYYSGFYEKQDKCAHLISKNKTIAKIDDNICEMRIKMF